MNWDLVFATDMDRATLAAEPTNIPGDGSSHGAQPQVTTETGDADSHFSFEVIIARDTGYVPNMPLRSVADVLRCPAPLLHAPSQQPAIKEPAYGPSDQAAGPGHQSSHHLSSDFPYQSAQLPSCDGTPNVHNELELRKSQLKSSHQGFFNLGSSSSFPSSSDADMDMTLEDLDLGAPAMAMPDGPSQVSPWQSLEDGIMTNSDDHSLWSQLAEAAEETPPTIPRTSAVLSALNTLGGLANDHPTSEHEASDLRSTRQGTLVYIDGDDYLIPVPAEDPDTVEQLPEDDNGLTDAFFNMRIEDASNTSLPSLAFTTLPSIAAQLATIPGSPQRLTRRATQDPYVRSDLRTIPENEPGYRVNDHNESITHPHTVIKQDRKFETEHALLRPDVYDSVPIVRPPSVQATGGYDQAIRGYEHNEEGEAQVLSPRRGDSEEHRIRDERVADWIHQVYSPFLTLYRLVCLNLQSFAYLLAIHLQLCPITNPSCFHSSPLTTTTTTLTNTIPTPPALASTNLMAISATLTLSTPERARLAAEHSSVGAESGWRDGLDAERG